MVPHQCTSSSGTAVGTAAPVAQGREGPEAGRERSTPSGGALFQPSGHIPSHWPFLPSGAHLGPFARWLSLLTSEGVTVEQPGCTPRSHVLASASSPEAPLQSGIASFSCGFLVILFFCLNPTGESRGLWDPRDIASNEGLRYSGETPLKPFSPFSFQSPFLARTPSLLSKVELNFLWPKGSQEDKPLMGKRAALRICCLIPGPRRRKRTIHRSPHQRLQS